MVLHKLLFVGIKDASADLLTNHYQCHFKLQFEHQRMPTWPEHADLNFENNRKMTDNFGDTACIEDQQCGIYWLYCHLLSSQKFQMGYHTERSGEAPQKIACKRACGKIQRICCWWIDGPSGYSCLSLANRSDQHEESATSRADWWLKHLVQLREECKPLSINLQCPSLLFFQWNVLSTSDKTHAVLAILTTCEAETNNLFWFWSNQNHSSHKHIAWSLARWTFARSDDLSNSATLQGFKSKQKQKKSQANFTPLITRLHS